MGFYKDCEDDLILVGMHMETYGIVEDVFVAEVAKSSDWGGRLVAWLTFVKFGLQ